MSAHLSKYLSLLLRHKPETIGLVVDEFGWARIFDIINKSAMHGKSILYDDIIHVVKTNNKKRFTISDDGIWIRANQGHSIKVELNLDEKVPPVFLYHGTIEEVYRRHISIEGISKMERHHVHLSEDIDTAFNVGRRRKGEVCVLRVDAKRMSDMGIKFYISKNGVWLTDEVHHRYITKI